MPAVSKAAPSTPIPFCENHRRFSELLPDGLLWTVDPAPIRQNSPAARWIGTSELRHQSLDGVREVYPSRPR